MRADLDLAYGSLSRAQRLDLFRPPTPAADGQSEGGRAAALPVVVALHGGGFLRGNKKHMRRFAHALVPRGYAVASVNYRLSGEAAFPAAVVDVKGAVRWLRANADRYGLDPTRIAAVGESAGGYLAAMLGTSGDLVFPQDAALGNHGVPHAVQAVVDLFGPVNFLTMDAQQRANPHVRRPMVHDARKSPESLFLGRRISKVPDLVREANPVSYLSPGRTPPPFLIEHGDRDSLVPYQQSEELAAGLRAVGGSVELTILPGVEHGLAFPLADRLPGIVAFLDGALRPARTTTS
ncbi:alpha/beta hydrolase [Frankia sp. CNm7]|uniref:Alpha/beta hydrolase n=2 Tax=Frankia nepalensis TaxID=1836974 RepID=A0A937RQ51_9ACTN|nr:alpha/beta hydrolase [Frankia nepalensis]MBL7512551.1 alpha/beta hydrolase [Frankia nepalensis]MBL7522402.1 alpha/beta hydrolase [Frankia nepalensis]MBL7631344.1 alpha/beta hydrolase [Frankia nepalensis]